MSRRLYALQEFFLGCFHPDWQKDSPTRSHVVEEYLRTVEPADARAVAEDLRELLDQRLSEDELHDMVLREYSLFYDPWHDEISMTEWLASLMQDLETGSTR